MAIALLDCDFAVVGIGSDRYDNQLQQLAGRGVSDPQELFFALTLEDVRSAAGQLRAAYDASEGRDGFVSFECTPDLANDADATIAQGLDLWACLDQPNVMIKVPGTQAGLVAIRELTRRGVNVNVTLLFSVERYEAVLDAYLAGLHDRVQAGESVDGIASAASFFLSRVDSKVDNQLPATSPLRGQIAIASARVAYQRYLARFDGPAWRGLVESGARTQRPLWASTGTKDPAYSDVRYVAQLIGPDVINTMPRPTLEAFADHGEAARTVDVAPDDAQQTLDDLATAGVDLTAITQQLEREGVAAFCDSYRALLDCIERQLARPRSTRADALSRRAAARRAPRPGCAPGRARRRGS